jgi:hypothetical protein
MISNEVAPKDPLISGSPSKIAKVGTTLYTANSRLWQYDTTGRWSQVGGVPSKIYDIAADVSDLYMLSVNDSATSVHRLAGNVRISNSTGYSMIQGIYSDGSNIYAGAMSGNNFAILEKNAANAFTVIKPISGPLNGAAKETSPGVKIYFATASDGVLCSSNGTFTTVRGTENRSIAGIINAEGRIIAVTGGGTIFEINVSTNTAVSKGAGAELTGALAVYKHKDGNYLLLLGVKNDRYNMGYREITIPLIITDPLGGVRDPGGYPSTVSDKDKYSATLAKCAVNSLMQLNVNSPVIFASTQKDGLWSYRNDEWNAEE